MTRYNVGDRVRLASGATGIVFGVAITAGAMSLQLARADAPWIPADDVEIIAAVAPPEETIAAPEVAPIAEPSAPLDAAPAAAESPPAQSEIAAPDAAHDQPTATAAP